MKRMFPFPLADEPLPSFDPTGFILLAQPMLSSPFSTSIRSPRTGSGMFLDDVPNRAMIQLSASRTRSFVPFNR